MNREELIAYDRWLTENKWGSSEIITPEQAADLYLTEHPLPPAEGAENIRQLLLGWEHYKRDHLRESEALDVEAILLSEYSQIAAQPQPTAEGAEEIEAELRGYARDIVRLHKPIMEVNPQLAMDSIGNDLVKMFNRLAQRIAEKMVSERLREYHLNEGYDVVIVGNPDKEIPGNIFEDIKVAALELGELRGLKVMITGFTANYLKNQREP